MRLRAGVAAVVATLALAACHDLDPTPPTGHLVFHVGDLPGSIQSGNVTDRYVSSHNGLTWYYLLIVNGAHGWVSWIQADRLEFADCARGEVWHRSTRRC